MQRLVVVSLCALASCGRTLPLTDSAPVGADANTGVPYGLNDVSVLFPLPTSLDDSTTLALSSMGNGGALLSQDMFNQLPMFDGFVPLDQPYESWRIVSARIDPCFPELSLLTTNPSMCRRQLRLIAQPLVVSSDPVEVVANDDALHLLYDLSEADFSAMATQWLAVRTTASSDVTTPLGVHPVISSQGLAGSVATRLRAVITAFAGSATLSQFTFLQGGSIAWGFGGFKVGSDGTLTPLVIFGIGTADSHAGTQQITSVTETGVFGESPASPSSTTLAALAGTVDSHGEIGGGTLSLTAAPADIASALQLSLDVDDPTKFNPDTLDCSTCHLADHARLRAATLGAPSDTLPRYENSTYNLSLTLAASLGVSIRQQRAFGFNGDTAVFNQRTVNDSAAVATVLSSMLPPSAPSN